MSFPARYAGSCPACDEHIREGDLVRFAPEAHYVIHDDCDSIDVKDRDPLHLPDLLAHPPRRSVRQVNPCPICLKPIADTAYVCHVCVRDLARRLRDSARDWPDLEDAIGRRMILRSRTTGTRKPRPGDELALAHETPLLINPAAMEQADIITNTATTWARHIIDERGHDMPTGRTPTQAALIYLADNLGWLAHRREAEEAFDELHCIRRDMEAAIDNPPPSRYLGPCGLCERDLIVRVGTVGQAQCQECGWTTDIAERLQWLIDQVTDRLEGAAFISRALLSGWQVNVSRHRIGMWASRGMITAKGHDQHGRPLYRIGDVLEIAYNAKPRHTQKAALA